MSEPIAGYVTQDLYLPRSFDEEFSELLVDGKRASDKPFPRKVDLWWASICIGAALGQRRPIPPERVKFHTGQVLANEQWRIAHMELLALGAEGEHALSRPARVIEIADEYGMAGVDWIIAELRGSAQPSVKLMMALEKLQGGLEIRVA